MISLTFPTFAWNARAFPVYWYEAISGIEEVGESTGEAGRSMTRPSDMCLLTLTKKVLIVGTPTIYVEVFASFHIPSNTGQRWRDKF